MAVVSGGTTLIDNGALDSAVPTGSLILLSTQTASSSASISFTSGIDSTYDSYVFKFINIHASNSGAEFQFQTSTDGGSNYNVTTTTTMFAAFHKEDNTDAGLGYSATHDIAQSTSFITIGYNNYTNNDDNLSGTFSLFNPSSSTYVKHFIGITNNVNFYDSVNVLQNMYVAGYCNTSSIVNAIQFKMSSGNIDDGIIKMYGVA